MMALEVLWWQGTTLLNPHFAPGTKDQDGSRIFYEPLASWDKDGKSVIWKLKRGVTSHDGKPFTSADVVFNWEYASDPATSAVTIGSYKEMKVEAVDSHAVKITFNKVTPFWATPFVGVQGMIIPKHLFDAYKGAKSREAPNKLKPVGPGAYKFTDFTPGDMVRGAINTTYHQSNKPFFDTIEMKGGGDAVPGARGRSALSAITCGRKNRAGAVSSNSKASGLSPLSHWATNKRASLCSSHCASCSKVSASNTCKRPGEQLATNSLRNNSASRAMIGHSPEAICCLMRVSLNATRSVTRATSGGEIRSCRAIPEGRTALNAAARLTSAEGTRFVSQRPAA